MIPRTRPDGTTVNCAGEPIDNPPMSAPLTAPERPCGRKFADWCDPFSPGWLCPKCRETAERELDALAARLARDPAVADTDHHAWHMSSEFPTQCVPCLGQALGRGEAVSGAERIAIERARQIREEEWAPEHDDHHDRGELAIVAAELAVDGTDATVHHPDGEDHWGLVAKHGYQGSNPSRVRALTIAGALIAAEIDRVLREEARPVSR